MLEFKVTPEERHLRIEAKSLAQVCTETVFAIRTIYKHLRGEDAELYKKIIPEKVGLAFIDDAEIAARTEDKSKQAINALNAAIEAMEKAMDTNAN